MFESAFSVILDFFLISLVSSQNVGSVILIDIYFLDKGSLIICEVWFADKGPLIQRALF